MDKYGIIATALTLVGVLIYLTRKKLGGAEKNCPYVKVGDPDAQTNYDNGRSGDAKPMTAQDLLELSWQFLYDMTEIVLYKFSATARDEVHKCGDVLVQYGMRYTHVVEPLPLTRGVATGPGLQDNSDTQIKR